MKRNLTQALALSLLAAACGGEQSMASKSAAAYREAQAKGIPVSGGHEHGGLETATAEAAEMDPSAHRTAVDVHAGHDITAGGTSADHAAMGHAATADVHAGHGTAIDHGAHRNHRQPANGATAMDHGRHIASAPAAAPSADPHAQHRAGATSVTPIAAPRSNAEMRGIQPSSTLQPDAFDAPAPVSLSEAAKAKHNSEHGSTRATPTVATHYICPMHPEVTSDKPGTCPKCGMTLVKKN